MLNKAFFYDFFLDFFNWHAHYVPITTRIVCFVSFGKIVEAMSSQIKLNQFVKFTYYLFHLQLVQYFS